MRRRSIAALPLALLAVALCLPSPDAEAQQCATNGSPVVASTGMSGTYVFKYLSPGRVCQVTMSNNAICSSTGPGSNAVTLTAIRTGPAPSCGWTCSMGACSVTTDGTDGLPVELLDFEIVEVEPAAH